MVMSLSGVQAVADGFLGTSRARDLVQGHADMQHIFCVCLVGMPLLVIKKWSRINRLCKAPKSARSRNAGIQS